MSLIRLANTAGTNLPIGDEGDYITVREEIDKRTRNALMKMMPMRDNLEETGLTIDEGLDFQTNLFEALVIGWSSDLACTTDNYLGLPPEATDAIDVVLADYFSKMMPSAEEQGKQ